MDNDWISKFKKEKHRFLGQLNFGERISQYTYYRIGGEADVLFSPVSVRDLVEFRDMVLSFEPKPPIFILGAGSNILVSDEGFRGIVLRTHRITREIKEMGSVVRVGTSVPVPILLREAAAKGWGGLEFLAGVPGTIGGCVFMNAGTHLGESDSAIQNVRAFDLEGETELLEFSKSQLKFEYRKNSFLGPNCIVFDSTWAFKKEDPAEVTKKISETLKRRKETQPIDLPSCGSVFKNPYRRGEVGQGLRSWEVIEKVGLRGHRIGGAEFSPKHPNFIVNVDNASAKDVKELIELAKTRALNDLGIELEEEVKYVGEF